MSAHFVSAILTIIAILLSIVLYFSSPGSKVQKVDNSLRFTNTTPKNNTQPKIAYLFAGSARSFICPKVHWSIKSHLIDSLGGEPFVFVRISDEDNLNVKTGLGTIWSPTYQQNEIEETLKVLFPRQVQHFSFVNQIEEMKTNHPESIHTVFRENDQRRYSMFYHRCMAYKMALDFELKNDVKFDWVVLVRLDAGWLEPVLPIESYASDRVWLTETGYDLFNDQFMLIPRQFSDYLYDLNTKVQKGVYCLGGPDVEKWKCTDPAKSSIAEFCCPDINGENWMGGSETIHKRHLAAGKIPVSLGRFPVFLTRIQVDRSCHAECDRLQMNSVGMHANRVKESYEYFAPYQWPDTRGKAISLNDNGKCLLQKTHDFNWRPIAANLLHTTENLTRTFPIDYSRSLYKQRESLHPSLLMNRKDLEAWRIHPTWNVEGCLSYSFEHKTLGWEDCKTHIRLKGGFGHSAQQSFFMQVVPHAELVQSSLFGGRFGLLRHSGTRYLNDEAAVALSAHGNVTRIMMPNREHQFLDDIPGIVCLSVKGAPRKQARVEATLCSTDSLHPSQIFRTVRGLTRGTHPATTVGRIHSATHPRLCVSRAGNTEVGLSNVPAGNELVLSDCFDEGSQQNVLFEFELVP